MTSGIDLTLKIISQSKNQAVPGILESAFHSTHELIRKLSGNILISRRTGQGLEAVIRDFDPDDAYFVNLVKENREKLIPGLRGAIVDSDIMLARQAFRLAYTQNFYEVLPTLTAFCLGPGSQEKTGLMLRNDMMRFIDRFTAALEKNEPEDHYLLFNTVLPEMRRIIAPKAKEFRFNPHESFLDVYLRLYPFLSEADTDLRLPLRLPNSPIYLASYRLLLAESKPFLFQFIIRCLDRLNPPPLALAIISKRADIPFLSEFFKSIKRPVSLELKTNLSKMPPIEWIGQIDSFIHQFDSESQQGLVLLLQNLPLPPDELQSHLLEIFYHGKEQGRVAALSALTVFAGDDIDRIVWEASADADPAVQIEALMQMNEREIPGASSRIIQFAESPHEEVRDTVQKLLPSFRFGRFMMLYDQLDDEKRRRMFNLVWQLDKNTAADLSKLLIAGELAGKMRGLRCIDYCNEIIPQIEDALCDLLDRGETVQIRVKAAEFLAAGRSEASRTMLVNALHRDADACVRFAAKDSLEKRPVYWQE
ncbi:MAG: hypothetical protein LBH00_08970 [Planctomycetaceae bacterium]|jgi:hypothetical protein|nr:hypothetical protein [Planctomycetaceae bacterium]